MSELSERRLAMKDVLVNYFKENSAHFFMDQIVEQLIKEGRIEESDRQAAAGALQDLYGDGKVVPTLIPVHGNTYELATVYQFDPREEIMEYLKKRGARESTNDLIHDLMANRGFEESEIKVELFALIEEGELVRDDETDEICIPRDE